MASDLLGGLVFVGFVSVLMWFLSQLCDYLYGTDDQGRHELVEAIPQDLTTKKPRSKSAVKRLRRFAESQSHLVLSMNERVLRSRNRV